jgi:hypothetical protein
MSASSAFTLGDELFFFLIRQRIARKKDVLNLELQKSNQIQSTYLLPYIEKSCTLNNTNKNLHNSVLWLVIP